MSKDWRSIKANLMNQRKNKDEKKPLKPAERDLLEKKFLTVQQLSEEPSEGKQKYEREGTQKFVPYNYPDITFENIKQACEDYIEHDPNYYCDILASERGPSCSLLTQIPKLNLIHCRFIRKGEDYIDTKKLEVPALNLKRKSVPSKASVYAIPSKFATLQSKSPKTVPIDLSVTKMMNAGCLIDRKTETIKLESFDIDLQLWAQMPDGQFKISHEPFASGAFRDCFKAQSITPKYAHKNWVIKKFNKSAKEYFEKADNDEIKNYTEESQCKKTVQMHELSKNIADVLQGKLSEVCMLKFKHLYYGQLIKGNTTCHVTVEEFIEGEFEKYINNTGDIIKETNAERLKLAECLTHFSHVYSQEKLIIVDIQGIGNWLIDPEIASSKENNDEENERMFTAGNLLSSAMDNFFSQHLCNNYCELLKLQKQQ